MTTKEFFACRKCGTLHFQDYNLELFKRDKPEAPWVKKLKCANCKSPQDFTTIEVIAEGS